MSNTKIEIILGCMFSGKSTELLRRVKRYKAIGMKTLLINNVIDLRTGLFIETHDGVKFSAIKLKYLMNIYNDYEDIYNQSDIIAIDEAQFFPDLLHFVLKAEKDNKIILIAGLDGDSNRKPFGQILSCIPLCDSVIKLKAMDMISKDGTEAIFTKRLINDNKKQILVGSRDKYKAVSRKNYLL